jgi:TRAP-type C4-dicarboxylate transport system permease small subunit
MSSPIVARLVAFQKAYTSVCAALAAFLLALLTVITSTEVFYRYALDHSLIWAEEACRSLLIWLCFLFAGVAFQRGEMIAVNTLTDLFSPRVRALIVVPAYLITSLFLGAMVYYGWVYAFENLSQTVPGLELLWRNMTGVNGIFPIFWVYLAVPVGFGILLVHMLASAVRLIIETFAPQQPLKGH